jgi:chemotaxis protein CheD
MDETLLEIGDIGVATASMSITTPGLGSCVAVALLCPEMRMAGLVTVALPESRINAEKARKKPGYFADTGIPVLASEMQARGCRIGERETEIKIAGGAGILNSNDAFNIGAHNIDAVRRMVDKLGLRIAAEDVGGHASKRVRVIPGTGEVFLSSPGRREWAI